MEITVVASLTEAVIASLTELDASFTTDTVLQVGRTSDGGFALREQPVDPPVSKRYRVAGDLRAGAAPPWDRLFVARADQRVVGVAATTYESWNARQRLDELHVTPAARGRGLARALVAHVREEGLRNGAREIWLETQTANLPAIRAYRRLGFTLTGIDLTRYAPPFDSDVAVFLSAPVGG